MSNGLFFLGKTNVCKCLKNAIVPLFLEVESRNFNNLISKALRELV